MITTTKKAISDLVELKNELPEGEKSLFERFFNVASTVGRLAPPASMEGWINKSFGSVARVKEQRIVKVTNQLTLEGSLFNELRASRPMECQIGQEIRQVIENSSGDPFCKPEEGTPADSFGRKKGIHCQTASNIAKYDGYHGVVIFAEHNPLAFSREAIADYFKTGFQWAEAAHREDPQSNYYFFMWNCLWKSGASIIHGHAQTTLTRGMHYPKVEYLRRVAVAYRQKYGANYFDDLYKVHQSLDLAWEWDGGVKGLAYLTPIKEKEILLWADQPGEPLYHAVHAVLAKLAGLCVTSFNLVLYVPPLNETGEDWFQFPALIRIVDRGDPNNKTADFGAMELYAASVISSDPFRVAEVIKS